MDEMLNGGCSVPKVSTFLSSKLSFLTSNLHNSNEPVEHLIFDKLSEQELRIAGLILRGYSYTEIAEALNIQPSTVKTHKKRIYSKLIINSKRELFALIEHKTMAAMP